MAPDDEREGLFRGDRRGIMAPPVEEGLFRGERRRGCTSPDRGRRACFRPLCVGGLPTLRFLLRPRELLFVRRSLEGDGGGLAVGVTPVTAGTNSPSSSSNTIISLSVLPARAEVDAATASSQPLSFCFRFELLFVTGSKDH